MPLTFLPSIAQAAAPTFQEQQRADLLGSLWYSLGHDVQRDEVGNVLTRLHPPQLDPATPALLLAAHLDTVFPPDTDVTVRQGPGRWCGPGIGDNSASLAILTALLRDLRGQETQLTRPLWVAATVGEEGLGDLRGAKQLIRQYRDQLWALIAVDGYLGVMVTQAVGVRRYRAHFVGPGGHSWGDQAPSALHALGLAISGLYALHRPLSPRTTLNVGLASGGNSVNSIASRAELLLDLRSLDPQVLEGLDQRAQGVLHDSARVAGVRLQLERVGDRPGGELRPGPLRQLINKAAAELSLELRTAASSTDANAAIPHDLPAVALGVYRGGNAHRLDEWIDPQSLKTGLELLKRVVLPG